MEEVNFKTFTFLNPPHLDLDDDDDSRNEQVNNTLTLVAVSELFRGGLLAATYTCYLSLGSSS